MCLLEAFACKVFPVVTDIPANRELIEHDLNGLLTPLNSPEAFAEAVINALKRPDKELITENNYQYIKKTGNIKQNLSKMEEIYNQLKENRIS